MWAWFPSPPWTVASTEVLYFSNLDIRVFRSRIMASLGSFLVRYFADTIPVYISVALWISSSAGTFVPVSQTPLVFQ